VTVTLPEDVIARLQTRDPDLGRAIVALTESRTRGRRAAPRPAELASYGSRAVILVTPLTALKRLAGVQLVPLGNGRALISLDPSRTVPQFELDVRDTLERATRAADRRALEALAVILREARRSGRVAVKERTIIVLDSRRQRAS
jgi:hypothetical protein